MMKSEKVAQQQYKLSFFSGLAGRDACLLIQLQDKRVDGLFLETLDVGLHELFQHFSAHHLDDAVLGEAGPVVGYPVLRVVVRPYLFAAVQGRHLRFPLRLLSLD